MSSRIQIRVTGVVQGVGFRPFVYTEAIRRNIAGFVANDSLGVLIEAEGDEATLADFCHALTQNAPPLARVDSISQISITATDEHGFRIHHSHAATGENTPVPPDIATCDACLSELFDPANRRYRYPFLNCTHCGPRFTITRELPYDRPQTTMAAFPMCAACLREYEDPLDRRFHAQPIACPDCGPQLALNNLQGEAALQRAITLLRAGKIVAIKGIGGFHLACNATNDVAVTELRKRKGRAAKPFAIMVASLDEALTLATINDEEAQAVSSRERPIVLVERSDSKRLSPHVAPDQSHLGIFLPYSPLHALLMAELKTPLVMTSGNRSNEPIARTNDEARERLSSLADALLTHNREIHVVADDSVVRVFQGKELPIRRSRGYAPLPIPLAISAKPLLAVGAELKATFCLARERRAYLSQHLGDMENLETQQAMERSLAQMQRLFRITPELVACDLHPGYLSSQWAAQFAALHNLPLIKIQHHHAHAASLMTEHNIPADEQILALTLDGTGLGPAHSDDSNPANAIWGGELLLAGYKDFTRLAHLAYMPLPGGDAATHKPYRTALAALATANIDWTDDLAPVAHASAAERSILRKQLATAPQTSSTGRLFDAAASLLGLNHEADYEAQGAMRLEVLAASASDSAFYTWDSLNPAPMWHQMVTDIRDNTDKAAIAARFHRGLAHAFTESAKQAHQTTGIQTIGLTGGVFQNVLLTELLEEQLEAAGFLVLKHHLVPPNDGGLALGQAAIAAAQ